MRIGLSLLNGRISPLFDVSRKILLVEVDQNAVLSREETSLPGSGQWDQVVALARLGPKVLICGAISRPLLMLLSAYGIEVIPFTAGSIEAVLQGWFERRLSDPVYRLPGCCRGPGGRMRWRGGPWRRSGYPRSGP
jgi:predicted Fe-Mo cluster-binding NifX family protein